MDRIQHTYYTEPDPAGDGRFRVKPGGTPIAEDEPYFTLRGNDKLAIETLERYIELAAVNDASDDFLRDVSSIIQAFRIYQREYATKVKVPD